MKKEKKNFVKEWSDAINSIDFFKVRDKEMIKQDIIININGIDYFRGTTYKERGCKILSLVIIDEFGVVDTFNEPEDDLTICDFHSNKEEYQLYLKNEHPTIKRKIRIKIYNEEILNVDMNELELTEYVSEFKSVNEKHFTPYWIKPEFMLQLGYRLTEDEGNGYYTYESYHPVAKCKGYGLMGNGFRVININTTYSPIEENELAVGITSDGGTRTCYNGVADSEEFFKMLINNVR